MAKPLMDVPHTAITQLFPSATNPRKHFDQAKLKDLAASIKEKGILEPLLVRVSKPSDFVAAQMKKAAKEKDNREAFVPELEIVAGERRYRAAQMAGLKVIPVILRELTDAQVLEIQIVENMQRDDLTPIEEAQGYKMLHEKHNYDWAELAAKIGKTKSYIYKRLKLLTLAPEVRQAVLEGTLPVSWAQEFLRIGDPKVQLQVLKDECGVGTNWGECTTLAELRKAIDEDYLLDLKRAPFSLADDQLLATAGNCNGCPKRTGAQADLLDDASKMDCCLDVACYKAKLKMHGQRVVKTLLEAGKKPITGNAADKFLKNTAGYSNLDEHDYELKGSKTWRKAAGTQATENLKTTVVVDSDGVVKEFAKTEALKRAVPKKALESYHQPGNSGSGLSAYEQRLLAWKNLKDKEVIKMAEKAMAAQLYSKIKLKDAMRYLLDREVTLGDADADIVAPLMSIAPRPAKKRLRTDPELDFDTPLRELIKKTDEKGLGHILRAMVAAEQSGQHSIPKDQRASFAVKKKLAAAVWEKDNPKPTQAAKKKTAKTAPKAKGGKR